MAKPRLIFVNRVYWPSLAATAQLLTDLAEGLAGRDWSVHVIAAGESEAEHRGVKVYRTGAGSEHRGMVSRAQNYWRFIQQAKNQIKHNARSGDIVVVMTDPPMLGALLTETAVKKGARVVHWIQDIYPEVVRAHLGSLAGWPLWPLQLKRNAAWRNGACCVVLGKAMSDKVAQEGIDPGRICSIPNWAPRELNPILEPGAVEQHRKSWNLSGKFIVAYSGNLGRVHEFSAIIAAAEILQSRSEIAFVFIGTGARLEEVRSAAGKAQLKNVSFYPPVSRDQLASSLAAAEVQLVSLKPGFAQLVYPSKLAGVLAAGRPVAFIGPPEGEIARLLHDEKCGATVPPNGGRQLADLILQWQANPGERTALGRQSRAAYEKSFTFDSVLRRWEEMLLSLSEPPPSA